MKIFKTANYKKIESSFEGQVFSPEMEDRFVGDVVNDTQRRKRTNNFQRGVPSAYKAKHPSIVGPDRNMYRGLGDLGRERGFVEDPRNSIDVEKKRQRIQKAIERDSRLEKDRADVYRTLTQDEIERMDRDIEKYELANPGKTISDRMLNLLIKRRRQDVPSIGLKDVPKKQLTQLNRVAYAINDFEEDASIIDNDASLELSEQKETNTILDFLSYLDTQIENFARSRELDPNSLKDYLLGEL